MSRWILALAFCCLANVAWATDGSVTVYVRNPPAPATPLGKIAFMFDSPANAQAWLAAPTAGVTAIGLSTADPTVIAQAHAAGLAFYYRTANDCGPDSAPCQTEAVGLINSVGAAIDAAAFTWPATCAGPGNAANWTIGLASFVNGPLRGNAPVGQSSVLNEQAADCTASGVAGLTLAQDEEIVQWWNPIVNPFCSAIPCVPIPPLAAPLQSIVLIYGTSTICGSAQLPPAWDTIAFWDIDNRGAVADPYLMDGSWRQNAQSLAATGDATPFCQLPISYINDTPPGVSGINSAGPPTPINVDFPLTAFWDGFVGSWNTPYVLGTCQYQVVAGQNLDLGGPNAPGAAVTLPWTTRPCGDGTMSASPTTITVGPNGNCNVSSLGSGLPTCIVEVRALTAEGISGNIGYDEIEVNF